MKENKKIIAGFRLIQIFFTLIFMVAALSLPIQAVKAEGEGEANMAACCKCTDQGISGISIVPVIFCSDNMDIDTCTSQTTHTAKDGSTTIVQQCTPLATPCNLISDCPQFNGATGSAPSTVQEAALNLKAYTPVLQVSIGPNGLTFNSVSCNVGQSCQISWLSDYIRIIYQYLVGLAAMLAAIVVMVAGFLWLTSAGSQERVKQAKDLITGALLGLLLALFSYLILYTINPELVANKPITINQVKPVPPGFGAGVANEKTASSSGGGGATGATGGNNINNTKLMSETQAKITEYAAHGCNETSGWRADGDGTRHQSGRVADFSFGQNNGCYDYITTSAISSEVISCSGGSSWGTAYYLPDGSVWVDENISVTGGSAPHFHTEFPDADYAWNPCK